MQLFVNVSPDGLVKHATEADQDILMMFTDSQPPAMTGTLQHVAANAESGPAQAHAEPDMEGNDMDGDKELLLKIVSKIRPAKHLTKVTHNESSVLVSTYHSTATLAFGCHLFSTYRKLQTQNGNRIPKVMLPGAGQQSQETTTKIEMCNKTKIDAQAPSTTGRHSGRSKIMVVHYAAPDNGIR